MTARRAFTVFAALAAAALASTGCSRTTAKLRPDVEARLAAEGIVHRADDTDVRRTHGAGTRRSGWDEMTASIVVTRRTILIHQNDRTLLEIHSGSMSRARVSRDHDRLTLRVGAERGGVSWSFHPPDDPVAWAADLRAVLKAGAEADSSSD